MDLRLTPLDIHFLRDADHVATAIGTEERLLRAENRALTNKLVDAEAEVERLGRMCRTLWLCIILLIGGSAWLGWLAKEAGR